MLSFRWPRLTLGLWIVKQFEPFRLKLQYPFHLNWLIIQRGQLSQNFIH